MEGLLTAGGAGVFALIVGAVLWKRKVARRTVGWLMLIAGFGIGGGLLGTLLHWLGSTLGRVTSVGTAMMFGVAVPAALVSGVGLWLGMDLWPRNKPSKALPYLALIFPVLLGVTGGIYTGIGGELLTAVGTVMTEFATALRQDGGA
ncbi:MAG: hypothetical protein ACRDT6_16185 [Micromonosporaceae bacterium]